jgi:hypothetical protein
LVAEASAVATELGFVDGVAPVVFVEPTPLADDHPRCSTIEALGGIDAIDEQVSWFRHATSPRPATANERRATADGRHTASN